MPTRRSPRTKAPAGFRARYKKLEQRRDALIASLAALGEKAHANPAYGRARTLLNETFRKASLVQRAAILEAAAWEIALIGRSTTLP